MKKGKEMLIKKKNIKNPILDAIFEYIDEFNMKFGETKETFRNAKLSTSDRKEKIVKDFFESFFPSEYKISRGEIFDYNNISNSIDCVIKTPNHPNLKTPMRPEIIIAEGVYAAIEVKPDISVLNEKSELFRGLKQCKSVKKLTRNIKLSQIEKMDSNLDYKKIPFIIFSKKSKDVEKTLDFIISHLENGNFEINEIPDVIFSLDGWLIYHTVNIRTSLFYSTFQQIGLPDNQKSVFMLFKGDINNLFCILLMILFKFPGPEYVLNDYIVNDYLLKLYNENLIEFSRAIWYE